MSAQPATKQLPTVINGVDVTALGDTITQIKATPELASFQFRARNSWLGGGRNRSTISGFYGAGREDTQRDAAFVLDADEPAVLLGEDQAANPVEFVLHALAACMTTTMVYHAAARGIAIEAVDSRLEGDLDLRGFLGLSPTTRKGYHQVRVRMRVKSDAPAATLKELTQFSPVHEMVSRALPVEVVVETTA
jgi:uncharacterized OsmC-like protein